jgi:hypothetical protein
MDADQQDAGDDQQGDLVGRRLEAERDRLCNLQLAGEIGGPRGEDELDARRGSPSRRRSSP